MPKQAYLGGKIRRLRREAGHTQVQLAGLLEISPSYLNLIESNQRALTVPLLLKLAELFRIDLKTFGEDDEAQTVADLKEAFADPACEEREITTAEILELVGSLPDVGRSVLDIYGAYRKTRQDLQTLSTASGVGGTLLGLESSRLPAEEVSDFIQEHRNHFPSVEEAAEELWRDAKLSTGEHYTRLGKHLQKRHGVRVEVVASDVLRGAVRTFLPDDRRLLVSEVLSPASLTFQVAHQIGLLAPDTVFGRALSGARFSTEESRRLARVALANSFASAVVMPYERFLETAKAVRYDVEILEHRFRASFEQVCHRLTSMNREGASGVPFHLVRVDVAGNISKRFSGSGIPFARYTGACPRWNVHAAFLTPGFIRTQLSEMPDGTSYFSIARTVRKAGGGHHVRQARLSLELGCEVKHARELVYADGIDLDNRTAAVPVGVSCRLCERMDCRQRAFPPMNHRLDVNENVRGLSFYYSAADSPKTPST